VYEKYSKAKNLEEEINKKIPGYLRVFVIKISTNLLTSRNKLYKHRKEFAKTEQHRIPTNNNCLLCNAGTDKWKHSIIECIAMQELRCKKEIEIRQNHEKYLRMMNIDEIWGKQLIQGLHKNLPKTIEERKLSMEFQIDLWEACYELWKDSRRLTQQKEKEKNEGQPKIMKKQKASKKKKQELDKDTIERVKTLRDKRNRSDADQGKTKQSLSKKRRTTASMSVNEREKRRYDSKYIFN
jgi:hypothetical protein